MLFIDVLLAIIVLSLYIIP